MQAQLTELKRKNQDTLTGKSLEQLAVLKAELQQKAAIYSPSHPALKPLQLQIDALEKMTAQSAEYTASLDILTGSRRRYKKILMMLPRNF